MVTGLNIKILLIAINCILLTIVPIYMIIRYKYIGYIISFILTYSLLITIANIEWLLTKHATYEYGYICISFGWIISLIWMLVLYLCRFVYVNTLKYSMVNLNRKIELFAFILILIYFIAPIVLTNLRHKQYDNTQLQVVCILYKNGKTVSRLISNDPPLLNFIDYSFVSSPAINKDDNFKLECIVINMTKHNINNIYTKVELKTNTIVNPKINFIYYTRNLNAYEQIIFSNTMKESENEDIYITKSYTKINGRNK